MSGFYCAARLRCAAVFALAALLAGCAAEKKPKRRPVISAADPGRQMLSADEALAREVIERGPIDAFARFSDATTVRVVPSGPLPQGSALWGPLFSTWAPGARLVRQPHDGRAAVSGDVGWTWGDYDILFPSETGMPTVHGRYLTAWHRAGDGSWRISADMSVDAPP